MPSPVGPRAPAPSAATSGTLGGPGSPGRTMTERCSLWSALSAAACCFYRGSLVQVQVRGRCGDSGHCAPLLRWGLQPKSIPAGSCSPDCGRREGGGVASAHLGVPRALRGARVQGGIPPTLDCRRRGSELELGLRLGVGFP